MHDNHENHCAICMRMFIKIMFIFFFVIIVNYTLFNKSTFGRISPSLILYVNERNWLYQGGKI